MTRCQRLRRTDTWPYAKRCEGAASVRVGVETLGRVDYEEWCGSCAEPPLPDGMFLVQGVGPVLQVIHVGAYENDDPYDADAACWQEVVVVDPDFRYAFTEYDTPVGASVMWSPVTGEVRA